MEGCEENTVWTWNAIGKQGGAWGLKPEASGAKKGFLLNHLISELLPEKQGERRITNSDPVTGQAAWFDLRVKIYKAAPGGSRELAGIPAIKPRCRTMTASGRECAALQHSHRYGIKHAIRFSD